ncbi:CBS domain-containing protein [Streptomyces libani]|uniref:CBS domain-containing protein n=2 Tax=Streptomyces nigrescens TaxID=1920 RepID=A0A640TT65_STRNI|nr:MULTISPECIES: CBS domain-containing protein [Streptomyces]MCW7985734.1 CBS domain-containing protein [Streptomyces platensis subsp. clarensis]MCX5445434.1 CBS domain-containing protein [Streptomyces libani]WAU00908.1 CBS domain-containing protein [Streptomyces libani subsp. libani]WAU08771.1 CBS domain-containing protein [Streptomyces nigrescens]WDT53236.1 CBS domain-containing protein [Streptomyces sp. G7(2002)]
MQNTPHLVSDVMTQTVAAVDREARFKEIVETMERWQVSALPVLAGEGRVVGVVSEADLLPKEEFRESDPDRLEQLRRLDDVRRAGALTAGELMTAPALTAPADATLSQAARTMARGSVKRLPVVDAHGVLQGIVSRADLLKVFLRSDDDLAEEVRYVIGELFATPVRDLRVTVVDGVVTLSGQVRDTSLIPVAARLVRAVEGVVDVEFDVTTPAAARTRTPMAGPHG